MVFFKAPEKHDTCGETLTEKLIEVNEKIISLNPYPIDYCERCKVYVRNEYESKNPEAIADLIVDAQAIRNYETHGSIYHVSHLEKIREKLS